FLLTFAAERDDKFLQCCKDKGLSDKCQAYCNYQDKGQKSAAYFNRIFTNRRRSPCPLEKLGDYVGCMAAGKDNRKCCEERGLKLFA
ncbi:DB module family protein, partial [Aphelenchoides avenae]